VTVSGPTELVSQFVKELKEKQIFAKEVNSLHSWLLVFKNENVKVKVEYGFVLYTGISFALSIAQIGNQNDQLKYQKS
jgi:hypothetical protein